MTPAKEIYMTYWKQYKEQGSKAVEITKEQARETLEGHWAKESLDMIFNEGLGFRLYTPFAEVWTKTEDGLVPMAGFYGIVG